MRKMLISLALSVLSLPLHAEKVIQCITNFPINAEVYTQVLKDHDIDAKVVMVDIKEYAEDLLIKNGKIHQLLREFNLDFSKKAQVPENVDKILFFNISPNVIKKYDLSRLPKEKMVLFMWEPKTVLETMYLPKVQQCFSKVYTWDDSLINEEGYQKFHYPVLTAIQPDLPSFENRKLCTLVASDLKSTYKNELYSARIQAIRYFEEAQEEGFEFYGRRWDPSQYKSFRGPIDDKLGAIKNYRFAICYENTHGSLGYVTEKIFDCFATGVIPIYLGADNIQDYVPKDCFIDRRDFASMEELHQFMKSMSKKTYEGYLARTKAFLNSEAAYNFTFEKFAKDFCEAVTQ